MTCTTTDLGPLDLRELIKEVSRVEARMREVSNELADPDLALGVSVRLSAQQRELEKYLQGILVALGEISRFDVCFERETTAQTDWN